MGRLSFRESQLDTNEELIHVVPAIRTKVTSSKASGE